MSYSDQRILPAIEQLSAEQRPITALEISQTSKVPLSTVKRGIGRLEKAGVIRRSGKGRRWGSHYEIVMAAVAVV